MVLVEEPGSSKTDPDEFTALRVKAVPGQAPAHWLPWRSLGVMTNVVAPAAVALACPRSLMSDGAPRCPVTLKVTISCLSGSSRRLTRAVHVVGEPSAKSRSLSPGSILNRTVSCSMRAKVPLPPWGTDKKDKHEVTSTSYSAVFSTSTKRTVEDISRLSSSTTSTWWL